MFRRWFRIIQVEKIAAKPPGILRVEAFDGDVFGVTLESGHTILLELGSRSHEPAFAALVENGDFCKPYTDGEKLCWPGGSTLTLREMLEMLLGRDGARHANGKPCAHRNQ